MKNLNPYPNPSRQVYRTAVDRKEDINLRARLNAIEPAIENQYDIYDDHFAVDTLGLLNHNPVFTPHRADIHSLYDYNSLTLREVKLEIEARQSPAVRYTCQYCTLTRNESFDHYLPKEEFPEYALHTNNLVPCCKTCNGYKSFVWRAEDSRLFINHYIDILPQTQYLFVEVMREENDELNFRFYLDNIGGIAADIYARIHTHFTRLRLLERMRMSAVNNISELENTILSNLVHLSLAEAIDTVISTADRNRLAYGANYWKSILEGTLVQNDFFLKKFFP